MAEVPQEHQLVSNNLQIGKTSSLVLTLSGVLKNIMIVFASMLLFHDSVSGLQFVGFAIALGGLVFYQLGGTPTFVSYWNKLRAKSPASDPEMSLDPVEGQGLLNESAVPLTETKHS